MASILTRLTCWTVRATASMVVCLTSTIAAYAGSPTLTAQPGIVAPASIPELARALKHDYRLIYEYVYTNIQFSPTFGLKKGALGTLLDGVGNDTDQSALLVALLRQSGYTADYVAGTIRLNPAQSNAWLGVDTTSGQWCALSILLGQGGNVFEISLSGPGPYDCTTPMNYIDLWHTWVSVTGGSLGSTTYVLDPSYKSYASTSGINLASAIGYDQSDFLATAKSGSTSTGNSIQNINRSNLRSALTSYAANLVSYIKSNVPTATLRDIIGGKYIQPLTQPWSPPTSLSYQMPGDNPTVWTGEVSDGYRTTLRIQIGGIDKTYFADQIYGHRLTIVYNPSNQPVLYLDGVVQGTGAVNASAIAYTVGFAFCFTTTGPSSPDCPIGYTNLITTQSAIKVGNGYTYAIVNSWDDTGRGMVEFRRRQLEAAKAKGGSDTSEAVLGEALNMIGATHQAQDTAAKSLFDQIVGTKSFNLGRVGIVGQNTAPYSDLPCCLIGSASLTADNNRFETTYWSWGGASSAFEWGVFDQFLTKVDASAVSTMNLFDIANNQHNVIYNATAASWSSIRPLLESYYSSGDLATIDGYIGAGYRLILPDHGNLTRASWTGAGYFGLGNTNDLRVFTYIISPNLFGGYTTSDIFMTNYGWALAFTYHPIQWFPQVTSFDPIDLSSGAFLHDKDDVSIGSSEFPVSLAFRRSYNSSNLYLNSPLSPAWTHNFAMTALASSDGLKGMGQDSPIDGAATIAAAYVIQSLFSDPTKPLDKFVIASLTQTWFMDQLINNTVNVTIGPQAEQFVRLADGSYNPRLGSSNRLTLDGSVYTLTLKDRTTLNFNSTGNIANWIGPSGAAASFNYDASSPSLLTSVSNNFGRSLTLGYNSDKQLVSVTDNASPARSVTYTYDSAKRLVSSIDPLGNSTTYSYTVNGPAPDGLLKQIFPPSTPGTASVTNTYDTLGRVQAQTNAAGSTWSYFFAGYRSEEDDPAGMQHVYYYSPRGKVLFDIQDYAGLGLLTKFSYDGLDRLTSTTLPEGGVTTYTYDATINPWANNIASIVHQPKPGSPLSALTTSFTYDSIHNKPTSITDPRGLQSTLTYDPWTGNLLSVAADKGASPHFNARSTFAYDVLGLPTSTTDPVGTTTQFAYDSFGNRTSVTVDAGTGRLNLKTTFSYNARGDPVSTTDPRGSTTTATYDDARRLVGINSPPVSAAPSGLVTTNSYDADGRLTQVRLSAGGSILATTSATYSPTGKPATLTDPNSNVTRYTYDPLDRLTIVTDALQRRTHYSYDAISRLTQVANPAIQATPLLQWTYTADGKVASLADANNNTTGFTYDGFDRLATTTYAGGSTEALTYDANSNVVSRKTRANDTIAYTWDTLNRLATKTPPSPAPVVTYTYDLASRIAGISDTSAAIPPVATPASTTAYTTSYTYDALDRLTGATWNPIPATATPPSSGLLVSFGHAYNATNQRTGQTVSDSTWIAYPSVTATTSYAINALNQYTAVGGVTPTYDGNGNLTSDGTYTYGYDAENRLVSASGSGNTAAYAFDGQDRRKSRTVNGTTTISVTDAQNREVLEYDAASGAILRWYAYGLGPNDLLDQMNVGPGTRATPLADPLGSIIGSVDSAAGSVTKFGYRPFGASPAAPAQFGFTGQRIDAEAGGLYHYRTRHYSPTLGRFLQPDPIGFAGGSHLYGYVGNDPLNLVDPTGLWATRAAAQIAQQIAQQQRAAQQVVAQATNARQAVPSQNIVLAADKPGDSTPEVKKRLLGQPPQQEGVKQIMPPPPIGLRLPMPLGSGSRPPNLTPEGAGRSGAFNEAKRLSGVPTSQQPSAILPNVDRSGTVQPGRIYRFTVPATGGGTQTIDIRDDAQGHFYGPNDPQNRGPHFNDQRGQHFDYGP